MKKTELSPYATLKTQIASLLQQARQQVIHNINTTIVQTYRHIGKYIVEYEQDGNERVEYGSSLLQHLSQDLKKEF
jgi:predicted alpha/beta superfamily hydrolase